MEEIDQLRDSLVALQKLTKKLRQLANRREAHPADLADARAALASVRAIYDRHDLHPIDIDSRTERKKGGRE